MIISKNFKKNNSTIIEVECDFKNSERCKNKYKIKYANAIINLKNNNNKIRCKYCTVCGSNNINFKHGLSHSNSRIYGVWKDIISRCTNTNRKGYHRYGGRGIKICDEWKADFLSFYNWSINNGYKDGLEIDRKNNDGNYEPNNCRWVTDQQNSFNRSSLSGSLSRYKGVSVRNDNMKKPYRAKICINKKTINIGCFENEKDAAIAYNKKTIELFGEYAYLNKIEG